MPGDRIERESQCCICEKGREDYPESQRWWIFTVLMFVGGYFGAFTYTIRGGVFCNAQTANFVLFAMAAGDAHWGKALYYLIPMSAYFLGAFLTEAARTSDRWRLPTRGATVLVAVEMAAVFALGLLPETAPFQISQVAVNFICSMQYNTFRAAEGVPMATTFCTNHLRQTGIACCMALRTRKWQYVRRSLCHLGMLAVFVQGGVLSTVLCRRIQGKAIWVALIPLASGCWRTLLRADLRERERIARENPPRTPLRKAKGA
jgi:uncharacterized membrane protein YoaK (UPF0700 family)